MACRGCRKKVETFKALVEEKKVIPQVVETKVLMPPIDENGHMDLLKHLENIRNARFTI